ncbi:hypothetical protein [Acidomonas methanolica]|uniref:hypothetical protein n=1 Tax=Acidomonas methanolica TaxID=437 RepID=UPI00211A74E9|nr:hypothetical protein [Acidomonas methanolica]MCQ9155534.1 hypothetical protein [Acidomonas methanolica]
MANFESGLCPPDRLTAHGVWEFEAKWFTAPRLLSVRIAMLFVSSCLTNIVAGQGRQPYRTPVGMIKIDKRTISGLDDGPT